MTTEIPAEDSAANRTCPLEIDMHVVSSSIEVSGGRIMPFSRAILSLRNTGKTAVSGIVPHVTMGQEGGSVQDISGGISGGKAMESLPSGGKLEFDVYDQLLPIHPGAASKVHMFGYRAVLNWRFDVTVWFEYRCTDFDATVQTPVYKWELHWSLSKDPEDKIDLSIRVADELKH